MGSVDQPQLMYPAPLAAERGAAISTNGDTHVDLETPILIVGGGPVGMLQALMFARLHGLSCTIVEREATTTTYPKMEYTNGRSMEIYRMMGLHDEFRAMATARVPEHYSNDELILTSLAEGGKLVHVWERDGPEQQRKKSKAKNDGSQYLEPHLRCHQILVEKWLKQKIEAEKLIQGFWNTAFLGLEELDDHVISEVKKGDGTILRIKSQYVIGCDGGGSWVRKSIGRESKREYLNLTVKFVHFRSTALRTYLAERFPRFWHANTIGGGILVSQNEKDIWTCHFMVPPGADAATFSTDDVLALTIGGCQGPSAVEYDEIYCTGTWKVEVAIAENFASSGGRVMLAGDAAHQLSPVGGHGLNSGLGDAFDLAWKIAGTIQGWAGRNLLSSYNGERRQIAFENLGHVTHGLKTIVEPILASHVKYGTETLSGESEESEKARKELDVLCEQEHWLHDQNGNILGYSYNDSPVIVETQEKAKRPKGTDEIYIPTTFPGSQAPHVWMKDGKSTLDLLSPKSFSIVDFSGERRLSEPFVEAAKDLGVPLHVLGWHGDENVRKVYERDLVLIRPDMHVAWRSGVGVKSPVSKEEARKILLVICGHA